MGCPGERAHHRRLRAPRNPSARVLALVLETNTTLRMLKLGYNRVNAAGAAALAAALEANTTLQELDLHNTNVGDAGVASLAAALKTNRTLQTLGLSSCNLDVAGVEVLAKALQTNETLQKLDLDFNSFSKYDSTSYAAIEAKLAHNQRCAPSPPPKWF